jgi:putative hydrolase of the HAD superfamily
MIGPQDEQPKQGPGDFEDVVTVELCDLDRQVGALLCVTRTGEDSRESVLALASLAGEPVASRDGGLTLETLEPLERWRCRFEHGEIVLDAELEAVSQPIDFAGINHGLSRGLSHYEQLCRVRGELRVNGHAGEIGGVGRRTHHWGEPSGARFRSLYAVAGDKAITVTAVRPLGAAVRGRAALDDLRRARAAPHGRRRADALRGGVPAPRVGRRGPGGGRSGRGAGGLVSLVTRRRTGPGRLSAGGAAVSEERQIRAVISDFGGVLTNKLIEAFAAFQDETGISTEQLGRGMQRVSERDGEYPLFRLERGEVTERDFLEDLAWGLEEELDHRPTLHRFREIYFEALHANEPILELMRELRDRGFRMAILTNNVREWEELWRSKLPLDEIFELIVDSAWVGMRKPEPEIYLLTIERLNAGLAPSECLFLDDNEQNVDAARELGMLAIQFRSNEQAIGEIRAALDGARPVRS